MTIGIFDSGIGGLSVLLPLLELLPTHPILYAADQAFCPYGPRPPAEIRARSFAITQALLDRDAHPIVVACNTATSAALTALRERWPDVPFVGMEPAVKPAAARTQSGHVGVLATATTARSERLAQLIDRFGRHVTVHVHVPSGLVELIEAGAGESDQAAALLSPVLHRWLTLGVDTVVLGCTHYPFARTTIERLVGPTIEIIDPAPAVARRTIEVFADAGGRAPGGERGPSALARSAPANPARGLGSAASPGRSAAEAGVTFLTTGDPQSLHTTIHRLSPSLAQTSHFAFLDAPHAPHLRSA